MQFLRIDVIWTTSNWSKEGAFTFPSLTKTVPYSININPKMFTKFRQATSDSTNRQDSIASRISGLFLSSGPSAITRFVISVVVNAIQGKPGRCFSHVREKTSEIIPSCTDRNSTSSITMKRIFLRIIAAFNHVSPHNHSFTRLIINTVSMNKTSGSCCFSSQTSTGSGKPTYEVVIGLNSSFTTFTETRTCWVKKSGTANFVSGVTNHFQSSKLATDEGFFSRHGIGSFSVVFSSGRPATTGAHCDYDLMCETVNTN